MPEISNILLEVNDIALLFSVVTASANGTSDTFLVSGIPREYDDLEGWTDFEDFLLDITQDTDIHIHADAYLYGEGEQFIATPEEVTCFWDRMRLDGGFPGSRCDHVESVDFNIPWCPEELFGQSFS